MRFNFLYDRVHETYLSETQSDVSPIQQLDFILSSQRTAV